MERSRIEIRPARDGPFSRAGRSCAPAAFDPQARPLITITLLAD